MVLIILSCLNNRTQFSVSDGKRRFSDTGYILTCPELNLENLVSCWLCNKIILMKMLVDCYHW